MKLIYAYIGKFRNILNQEVHFTEDFLVRFGEGVLTIEQRRKGPALSLVFGDNALSDLHIIIGKTGSGKTNLLQLIGMDEYERDNTAKTDSYLLLYSRRDGRFLAEMVNINIEGLENPQGKSINFGPMCFSKTTRIVEFSYNYEKSRPENAHYVNTTVPSNVEDTFIVNGFDRHAFSLCPYTDERREGVSADSHYLLPRYIAPFERTQALMVSEIIREYIAPLSNNNIKRKAALVIESDNWSLNTTANLDEELIEREYWTYYDWRLWKKETPKKFPSAKIQFIHDLMANFARYLREFADGVIPLKQEGLYHPYFPLGVSTPWLLPDGKKMSLQKRIDWLCQYIDFHSDEMMGNRGLLWQIGSDIIDIGEILKKFDEKYFTETTFTIPVMEMDLSDGSPLADLFERMEQYRPDQYGVFTKELLPYHFTYLSSGEYQYAKVWGALEEFANRVKFVSDKDNNSFDKAKQPNYILLMDEPETFMHPEFCRQFIAKMYHILAKRNPEAQMQVILSTHSPFMLSDVLSSQVTRVDYNERGECVIYPKSEKSYFAANIHTIMADGFFLDYTIGEYAKNLLTEKFRFLKELTERVPAITKEEWIEVQRINELLPHIGDEMIRHSFNMLLKVLEDAKDSV